MSPLLFLALLCVSEPPAKPEEAIAGPLETDCGFVSLGLLMHLEGRPTEVGALRSALPGRPGGFSLLELREAASERGLDLVGVRLKASDFPLDRPALVFTRRDPDGHDVVVRSVGHTGRLVQVMDPAGGVSVAETADLLKDPSWTGMALIPRRRGWRAGAFFLAPFLALAALAKLGRRPWARRVGPIMAGLREV